MKHEIYKMLFDRNKDGSVTYDQDDRKIITKEYETEQHYFAILLGNDFNQLIAEIESRIRGVATFAYNDKTSATHIHFGYEDTLSPSCGIATVCIDLWGERLNEINICKAGEQIGTWNLSKESDSHRLFFVKQVPKEIVHKAFSFSHDI